MSRLFFSAICKACCRLKYSGPSGKFAGAGAGAGVCANNGDGGGACESSVAAWNVIAGDCAAVTHTDAPPKTKHMKACRSPERRLKYRKKQLISRSPLPGQIPPLVLTVAA